MQLPAEKIMMRFRNKGATQDLVIPVDIVCNTSDEVLISNIKHNSRLDKKWLAASEPHDGIAIICGSGPSIADDIDNIRKWQEAGATIFALNGCAAFLSQHDIEPDYQVMCDARKENVELIGSAKTHLFASQCDPVMFAAAPNAVLWHLQIGDIESYFPEYKAPYVLIGGAASVGNTTTCVAYAMGYRTIHIYGMDSSHRNNKGHAFYQKLNEGDPTCITEFNGKKYLASLTMKHQAEKFQETARALQQMGTKIHVHGTGLLPDMWNTPKVEMTERDKYVRMWEIEGYRSVSPGEECVDLFLSIFRPAGSVIDFGCGTGRAGLKMKEHGLDVLLMDFTTNSRDPEAELLPFVQQDLTKPIFRSADYGYCTDVMEHIESQNVESVIHNIMNCVEDCFFQISTVPDSMGALIGQDLHLTVKPLEWWEQKFLSIGYAVLWRKKEDSAALLFVTKSYKPLQENT